MLKPLNCSRNCIEWYSKLAIEKLDFKLGDDLEPIIKSLGGKVCYKAFWFANKKPWPLKVNKKQKFKIYTI